MSTSEFYKGYSNEEMKQPEIRLTWASDPQTPPSVLKALSKDPDWLVRNHVATNPGTPEGCLWDLTYDPDTRVRSAAFSTLDFMGLRLPGRRIPLSVQIQSASARAGKSQKSSSEKIIEAEAER